MKGGRGTTSGAPPLPSVRYVRAAGTESVPGRPGENGAGRWCCCVRTRVTTVLQPEDLPGMLAGRQVVQQPATCSGGGCRVPRRVATRVERRRRGRGHHKHEIKHWLARAFIHARVPPCASQKRGAACVRACVRVAQLTSSPGLFLFFFFCFLRTVLNMKILYIYVSYSTIHAADGRCGGSFGLALASYYWTP